MGCGVVAVPVAGRRPPVGPPSLGQVLVLQLPRPLLEKALPAAEREVARRPDGWTGPAARGKLRRYLGDPRGLADLVTAGDRYMEIFEARNPNLLTAANLHRLGGSDRAEPLLVRLHADLSASVEERGPDATRNGVLVDACFLLGRDEQCQQVWTALAAADPRGVKGTRHGAVAVLARARAQQDLAACEEAVAAFDAGVSKEPASFAGTGGMNFYDWLEVALTVHTALSGRPSPRLHPLEPPRAAPA